MTQDNQERKHGSTSDLIAAGASAVLGLFPLTAPIAVISNFGLFAWQKDQQEKFIHEVQQRLETLDTTKLDQSALESNEFKSVVIQVMETALKSASDLKRQALAQALVNSIVLPTSRFTGKQALFRILSQISDEEILTLSILQKGKAADNLNKSVGLAEIANKLQWSEQEAKVACEGLLQLGLILDAEAGRMGNQRIHEYWHTTALGDKFVKWCTK